MKKYDRTGKSAPPWGKSVQMKRQTNCNNAENPVKVKPRKKIPLLVAIREASRAAHRWRDAAQSQYQHDAHGLAKHSRCIPALSIYL